MPDVPGKDTSRVTGNLHGRNGLDIRAKYGEDCGYPHASPARSQRTVAASGEPGRAQDRCRTLELLLWTEAGTRGHLAENSGQPGHGVHRPVGVRQEHV